MENDNAWLKEAFNYAVELLLVHNLDAEQAKARLMSDKNLDETTAQTVVKIAQDKIAEAMKNSRQQKPQQPQKTEEQKKKERKIRLWLFAAIGLVVLFIIGYNLPYFEELREYHDVVDVKSVFECQDYLNKFPSGKHAKEVLALEEEYWYRDVIDNESLVDCGLFLDNFPKSKHADEVCYLQAKFDKFPMGYMVEYLQKFPNGKYAHEINLRCDEIWDSEIAKYTKRDKGHDSPEAVAYFTEMLQYMKAHRINEIAVDVNSNVSLTDYSSYSQRARDLLEEYNNNVFLPIESNIVSIKENFTRDDESTLTSILVDGVQQSFNKIFSDDFIKVSSNEEVDKNAPQLVFDYTIKSQEFNVNGLVIPDVWTYSSNNIPKKYLIGISINFSANFSIPGSSTKYSFSAKGEPEDDISNISDINDGYRVMTTVCFEKFSNKMSSKLGLAEVYLQDDKSK